MNASREAWGWDEAWEAQALEKGGQAYLEGAIFAARVTEIQKSGPLAVSADADGGSSREGRLLLTGAFAEGIALPEDLPVVGDWLLVRCLESSPRPGKEGEEESWLPLSILQRRSFLARKSSGSRHGDARSVQALAANIDRVIVMTACGPDFSPPRVERMLALAHASGSEALVILTKTDLASDPKTLLAELVSVSASVPVLGLSAATGAGFEELQPWLVPGKTLALLGSSGVGKSTLINALAGSGLAKTRAVRMADGKGVHTTTHRELHLLDSGVILLDNPGMREVQLWVDESDLDAVFPEIAALAVSCRFKDCSHISEPGCAVLAALDSGRLDRARYERWLGLLRETAFLDRRVDRSAASAERSKWKSISKSAKSMRRDRESRGMI